MNIKDFCMNAFHVYFVTVELLLKRKKREINKTQRTKIQVSYKQHFYEFMVKISE